MNHLTPEERLKGTILSILEEEDGEIDFESLVYQLQSHGCNLKESEFEEFLSDMEKEEYVVMFIQHDDMFNEDYRVVQQSRSLSWDSITLL